MGTETKKHCAKLHSHICELANLIDDFGTISQTCERHEDALNRISDRDFGLLGGDESWTVDQWHDYIREIIAEFQVIAREVL